MNELPNWKCSCHRLWFFSKIKKNTATAIWKNEMKRNAFVLVLFLFVLKRKIQRYIFVHYIGAWIKWIEFSSEDVAPFARNWQIKTKKEIRIWKKRAGILFLFLLTVYLKSFFFFSCELHNISSTSSEDSDDSTTTGLDFFFGGGFVISNISSSSEVFSFFFFSISTCISELDIILAIQ